MKTDKTINKNKCDVLPVNLPEDWSCLNAKGPGPFATKATLKTPEGKKVSWTSRHKRKHHFQLDKSKGSTWWAPGAIGWWIGVLFSIGATCFAVGAIPSYLTAVGDTYDGLTFFIGSIFFTSAAFLQYLEAINTPYNPLNKKEKFRILVWAPNRIGWWAVVVQFIGTVFFNLNTFNALRSNLSINQLTPLVWIPDAYGSICFLVASLLAWMEVSHALWSWRPRSFSWNIAGLNMLGSIFFGISAAGAFVLPGTGLPLNMFLVNMGTFAGGVCFLVAAILLLPERVHETIKNPPSIISKLK
ncbi:hypothetical protein [Methanobacterium sp.]|jgi:hypothetical protein|uniref:hypothetical protein n=1 Tax=Methanobacterium sp. TaxID=2164 RepID=UPI003159888D